MYYDSVMSVIESAPVTTAETIEPYGVMDVVNICTNIFRFSRGEKNFQGSATAHIALVHGARFTPEIVEQALEPMQDAAYFTFTNAALKNKHHVVRPGEEVSVLEKVNGEVAEMFMWLSQYLYEDPAHAREEANVLIPRLVHADFRWLPIIRQNNRDAMLGKDYYSNLVRYGLLPDHYEISNPEFSAIFKFAGQAILGDPQYEYLHNQVRAVINKHKQEQRDDIPLLTEALAGTALDLSIRGRPELALAEANMD